MKYLIAGLGNPGKEYENTRHNIGFLVVEKLAAESGAVWNAEKHVHMARTNYKGRILILIKPQTYMNLSGKAVSYWLQAEKIRPENLVVITDDLALPCGKLRLKLKGSDGGHNGLKSIDASLSSQDYPRLRFGIGNDFPRGKQVDFVLGEWNPEEIELIAPAIEKAVEAVKLFVTTGPGETMTRINAK